MLRGLTLATLLPLVGQAAGLQPQDNVSTRPADSPVNNGFVGQTFTMNLFMEDGTPPPKELIVRSLEYCQIVNNFGSGTIVFIGARTGCQMGVWAPGIRSAIVPLRDGSTYLLKRLGEHEGSAISFTVLNAPPEAKKAYSKAAELVLKKKSADAQKYFESAVRLYPDYALAWSELATLLEAQGQHDAARSALIEAIRADKKYLKPLVQLAALEANLNHWPASIQAADTAISLQPIEFPGAYYYRSLAHLQAREWTPAARMAEMAIKHDSQGEFPKAILMLSTALDRSGDKPGAIATLERFLLDGHPTPEQVVRVKADLKRLNPKP